MGDRDPKEVLEYILQHKGSIIKVLQSVKKARDARAHCKKYVLCVKEPPEFCDPEDSCETLIIPGNKILQYIESCKEDCPEHEFVYSVLKHASFFTKVFRSVELARNAFEQGNIDKFGEFLDVHWNTKKQLSKGVSNPFIDECYELAKRNGALGGKIMGAGGGGFFMFYHNGNNTEKTAFIKELANKGLKKMRYNFEFEGSKIILNMKNL